MGDRLWIHGLVASVTVFSLILLGCQSKPKTVPSMAMSANANVPVSISGKAVPKRETIFFLKADASLSPGALSKLRTWTASWGTDGTWLLASPANPGITSDLREKRILVLRSELQKLGVLKIETKLLPAEPAGQYDAIYIEK